MCACYDVFAWPSTCTGVHVHLCVYMLALGVLPMLRLSARDVCRTIPTKVVHATKAHARVQEGVLVGMSMRSASAQPFWQRWAGRQPGLGGA